MEIDKEADLHVSSRQKFYRVYKSLKEKIENNSFGKTNKLPTEVELAEIYDVSRPTVAKALDLLRSSGYIERVSGTGTFVRYNAKKDTKNFALLIPGLGETEIFESICGHMSHLAEVENFNLIWTGSMQEDARMRREHIKSLAQRYITQQHIDGVFFCPLELISEKDLVNQEIADLFENANIPIVLMDRDISAFPERSSYDLVSVDNFRLAFVLAKHMLNQGCRTLRFLARPYSAPSVKMRIYGFRQALLEEGISAGDENIIIENISSEGFAERLLGGTEKPGILCANDTTASELMHVLERGGWKIPQDVKVAGVDDVRYAKFLRVPLTTYRQPVKEIAKEAVELMLSRVQKPNQSARKVVLSGELVVRESTY
ncbi:substrate-binding domain-containing protein [Sedimentisphaera salicampi]|uniref:Arabinose metabolism transcriptional repressor n=1 Tax=Sedimentisphaera salicampi TaxID=1941349 RepID=A0A1W6LLK4_9BACT|nr:GntR family transcriptional regulator [Sedimentisphaera salicampi]ARN56624.1 Arabinose metabolism transcriptional repressor [Sedimentisphaera salicampi]OXU15511.1 Arabinose metabolism transcriptional repressor [Sedimentisphaera salicampi]